MPYKFAITHIQDCIGCMACIEICPEGALAFKATDGAPPSDVQAEYNNYIMPKGHPVQVSECGGCFACVNQCPTEGISVLSVKSAPTYERGDFFVPELKFYGPSKSE